MVDVPQTLKPETPGPAEQTRLALIRAGLSLFGQKGFDATSTRELALMAKANVGSIAYHFGGKEGLRDACATHIVETIKEVAGAALGRGDGLANMDVGTAEEKLAAVAERMVSFIVAKPDAGEIVQFVLREMARPTSAFDIIYSGVFEPIHKNLCRLWEQATGEPADSEDAKISVFTIVGQVMYFRIGRAAILRRMGWNAIGAAQAAAISAVAGRNVRAAVRARRRELS